MAGRPAEGCRGGRGGQVGRAQAHAAVLPSGSVLPLSPRCTASCAPPRGTCRQQQQQRQMADAPACSQQMLMLFPSTCSSLSHATAPAWLPGCLPTRPHTHLLGAPRRLLCPSPPQPPQQLHRNPTHLLECPPNAPMSLTSLWMAVPLKVSLAPSAGRRAGRQAAAGRQHQQQGETEQIRYDKQQQQPGGRAGKAACTLLDSSSWPEGGGERGEGGAPAHLSSGCGSG